MTRNDIWKSILVTASLMTTVAVASSAPLEKPELLFSYGDTNWSNVPSGGDKKSPADGLSYDQQLEAAQTTLQTAIPKILQVLEIAPEDIATLTMPGGYKLSTLPTFQSSFEADTDTANEFASAVGYVFRQWSVLVTDFTPNGSGNATYGTVTFDHVVTGAEADDFFRYAATVHPALGQGYSAFDEDMFFINLTDSTGTPYGGESDENFLIHLRKAAETYSKSHVKFTQTGRVDARFIQNDWKTAPDGEEYARTLGDETTARLKCLRAEHEAIAVPGCS
jgi:hypothetical protein